MEVNVTPSDKEKYMKKRKLHSQIKKYHSVNSAHACKDKETKLESYISLFNEYLKNQRGLLAPYRIQVCRAARLFLQFTYKSKNLNLSCIQIRSITSFINAYAKHELPYRTQKMATFLRSFLHFLKFKGLVSFDFSVVVPSVAVWRQDRIPEFLTEQEIKKLLKYCDKRTSTGLRDYTILRLILSLGLRPCEVSALTLEDFDWNTGVIIIHGKGPKISNLPLTQDLGDDLVAYLLEGRPHCLLRNFFISVKEPYCSLKASDIGYIVWLALKRAGLKTKGRANMLRHTLATSLLNKGASLQEVGEVLRHQSINTTTIYAKVDFNKLRSLALPWPGNLKFGGSV